MRKNIPTWFTLLFLGNLVCHGQEHFPYHLTLGEGPVEVRSGPGPSFYITDHLSEGSTIEVYRHHEGGWLGIRPPAGSFSWVPGERLTGAARAGIARVLRDDTICRVGSRVAEVEHHVGQVYLEYEENVQLLDDLPVETQTARQLEREGWRRIAPPAGEFRWVRASDIKRPTKPPASPLPAVVSRPSNTAVGTVAESAAGASAAAGEPTGGVRQASHWHPTPPGPGGLSTAQVIQAVALDSQDSPPDDPIRDESDSEETKPEESGEPQTGEDDPNWMRRGTSNRSSAFQEKPSEDELSGNPESNWTPQRDLPVGELLDVEMRLAMAAAREIHLWRLQPLRDRIEAMQPRLKTDAQREHARSLLERIEEYETLQNRFAVAGENAPLSVFPVPAERTGAVGPAGWEDSLLSRFDGSGWLVPVHSTHRVAPPFALLDAEGEVLSYVAPSPGLNLHRFLRKRVGIYGQRLPHPSLNKPLLTAERVVDLGRHLH
jgi:SH3-like domain-containing protein